MTHVLDVTVAQVEAKVATDAPMGASDEDAAAKSQADVKEDDRRH